MSVFVENSYISINKYGEQLCGDKVETLSIGDETTIVLADGLGSGVKANILSTLTSKMLCTMIAKGQEIEDAITTVIQSLPVCSERKIAYSTFSVVNVNHKTRECNIIEFDNPEILYIRDEKFVELDKKLLTVQGKKIYISKITAEIGDYMCIMSDGVIHAGIGTVLNLGWNIDSVKEYISNNFVPNCTARDLACLLSSACDQLYMQKAGDDTTVCGIKIVAHNVANIMVGPPIDSSLDKKVCDEFFADKESFKIVCGGTTSKIVSKYLDKPVEAELEYLDKDIPPTAKIEGVDLVTEGVITLSRVLELCKEYLRKDNLDNKLLNGKDGASKIAKILIEKVSDIKFFVGRAINPAHQNPNLPIGFSIKMTLIENIAETLRTMGKRVTITCN